ncbi:unnamed protein product [Heterobilharzia americana]|nr:unnamed protein product [Heterobilharzia americana]
MKNNQPSPAWKSSPSNLLEHIWRATPNFQSFFDPSLTSFISQSSSFKNQNQSQSRDTVLHSSSHNQITE